MPVAAPSPRQQLLIGLAAAVAGLSIVAVATGIFAVPEQSFRAPHWVLTVAGLVFVLTGAMFLAPLIIGGFAPADQYTDAQKKTVGLVQQILGSLLLTGFAAIPLWIGFGPGERLFGTSIGISGLVSHGSGDATTGRVVFGAAGILIGLWAALTWIALFWSLVRSVGHSNDERA